MSQVINLADTETIQFNGNEVDAVQLNGELIWGKIPEHSEMILRVQRVPVAKHRIGTTTYQNENFVCVMVSTGEGGASVTYGGITKTLEPNSQPMVYFGLYGGIDDGTPSEGELIIDGDYNLVSPGRYNIDNEQPDLNDCITEIVLWDNSKIIDTISMFRNQAITQFKVSPKTIEIDPYMFYDCPLVGDVIIPNGILRIGSNAFGDDLLGDNPKRTDVDTLFIPSSVEFIDFDSTTTAFNGMYANNIIVDPNNPYYDSRDNCNALIDTATNTLLLGSANTVIPSSVKTIGESSFMRQTKLSSIIISEGVEEIGATAFSNCTGLTEVTISEGVVTMGTSCFYKCTGLTEVTIPDSVVTIGNGCFNECSNLTTLVVGENVTSIGSKAFALTGNLKQVVFKQSESLTVTLPSPGSTSGMFYNKSARAITVYTDNTSLKNYNYRSDNATVTIKPLSEWHEETT